MLQHKQGFTLLEVTVAITVFVIGVLSVFSLFPQGVGALQKNSKATFMSMAAWSLKQGVEDVWRRQGESFFTDQFWQQHATYSLSNELVQEGLFELDPASTSEPFAEIAPLEIRYRVDLGLLTEGPSVQITLNEESANENSYTAQSYIA